MTGNHFYYTKHYVLHHLISIFLSQTKEKTNSASCFMVKLQ